MSTIAGASPRFQKNVETTPQLSEHNTSDEKSLQQRDTKKHRDKPNMLRNSIINMGLSAKKFKLSKFVFDPTREELIAKMREIAPEGRIKDKEIVVAFLAKTYQKPIAEIITNFMFKYCFSDYAVSINIDDFFKNIQNFVNKSDNYQWVRF